MTNGVFITYGDVAIGAREQFAPETTDKTDFSDLSQLKEDLTFPNYTNPCELYNTVLDGDSLPIPYPPLGENLGWWSEQVSNENGEFDVPIVLILSAKDYFYSRGITLYFDTINNLYADSVKICWYRDDELISEKNFNPDSAKYFCENVVEFFNRIEITFYSINIPYNRLKLHSVIYGYGAEFYGNQLNSVKLTQEIDVLSTQISINTCDFGVRSANDATYTFAERQPVCVYFNGKLKAKTFVKSFNRKSETQWQVKTEDYIGIMQNVYFSGGIYKDANVFSLLKEIFDIAKVPFTVDDAFKFEKVSGYIPYTSCRDALMQVAFAIGATVDTSEREDVHVYKLSDEFKQTIPLNRIMQGQRIENETRLTAFELTSHEYVEIDETLQLYKSELSGQGIFVKFPQPVHDLSIVNGQILESGANYAIINAQDGCVLSGKKYDHIETVVTKKNPLILATDMENIVAIQKATLVSKYNVDKLIEKCYNYFANKMQISSKVVEGKHTVKKDAIKYGQKKYGSFKYGYQTEIAYDMPIEVGDYLGIETQYSGTIRGRVIRQSYNLNGGIIIKDTTVR